MTEKERESIKQGRWAENREMVGGGGGGTSGGGGRETVVGWG